MQNDHKEFEKAFWMQVFKVEFLLVHPSSSMRNKERVVRRHGEGFGNHKDWLNRLRDFSLVALGIGIRVT